VSFQISAAVLSFAETHFASVDELAVLVALVESSTRWWDARMVARELGVLPASAAKALEHLAAANLLDIRVTDEVRYQFHPASPELGVEVRAFVDAYRRYPAIVMRAVHSKTSNRSARDFADAFRIRRDERG
jgi:hypothetical protein